MKKLKILFIVLVVLTGKPCFGQESGFLNIQKKLQENTDTTFIFQTYNTNELQYPSFKVLSKTSGKISLFEYKVDPINENGSIYNKSQSAFNIDTSKFYYSKNISSKDAKLLWEKIIKLVLGA